MKTSEKAQAKKRQAALILAKKLNDAAYNKGANP
jgi:hypothetical protein